MAEKKARLTLVPSARRIILSVLTMAIVLLGMLFVMTLHLRELFVRAEFYKTQLRQYEIYDAVYEELSAQLAIQSPVRVAEDAQALFSLDDLEGALETAFPPLWLQTQVERFLDSTESWLYSDAAEIDFALDIREQKEAIPEALRARMLVKFETLPVCTTDELLKLMENHNQLVYCRPRGLAPEDIWREFEPRYLSAAAALPDQLTFRELLDGELLGLDLVEETPAGSPVRGAETRVLSNYDQVMLQFENLRSALAVANSFLLTTAIAMVALALLVLILNWRHPLALIRWLGVIGLGLGLDLTIIAVLLRVAGEKLSTVLQQQAAEVLSPELQLASIEVPLNALRLYGDRILGIGLAGLGIGAVFFVLRFIIDVNRRATR